jgi:hypothetical protein
MVATAGRGWRLAPSLVRLVNETDRLFPKRSKASDGSIGDPAHAARASDHNPDDGWVDAVDITDDDKHGCDVGLLVAHLVATKDDRISYLIHKGTIWKGYTNRGLRPFTPQVYTGPNAHKLHAHISIKDSGRTSTKSWWPQSKPAPKPPSTAKEIAAMKSVIIKGTSSPNWYISDGITKRYISSPSQAAVIALTFGAEIAAGNQPYVLDQAIVNAITTV